MKSLKYSILFAVAFMTYGCQEEIQLDLPDNDPELVVEGYLTQRDYSIPENGIDCFGLLSFSKQDLLDITAVVDSFVNIDSIENATDVFPFNKVVLSTTSGYFSNGAPPAVPGAVVELYEDGNLVETLIEDAAIPGTYRITHLPKVGSEYNLMIEAMGNTYETGREIYESVPPLISVEANYGPNFIQDSCAYYMNVNTFEKPGLGDHYRWFFYINNEYDARPNFISTTPDDGFDGLCLLGFDVYGDELELGDSIVVFQMRTTENYNTFVNSIRNQTANVGSPFDSPPAPIRGNVTNITTGKAAFGYFAAGGISANAVEVPSEIPAEDCLE